MMLHSYDLYALFRCIRGNVGTYFSLPPLCSIVIGLIIWISRQVAYLMFCHLFCAIKCQLFHRYNHHCELVHLDGKEFGSICQEQVPNMNLV
jgi:hypothetical protein